jgi:hypothetical protein
VRIRIALLTLAAAATLAGCSFQNKYEREAEKLTQATIANNWSTVQGDIAPGFHITRVQVAAWSDELNDQGKLESVKEVKPCPVPGEHCFEVKFQKSLYHERLALDDQDKVLDWHFQMADAR